MALNKFNKMFRVKWCQRRHSWRWANTIFIDITTVCGVEAQGYVWAKPGENIATQRLEGRVHGPQVFVLGAISREGPVASPSSMGGSTPKGSSTSLHTTLFLLYNAAIVSHGYVLRFWGGLSVPLINQYIDHQFRNIKAIIKAKGDHIHE